MQTFCVSSSNGTRITIPRSVIRLGGGGKGGIIIIRLRNEPPPVEIQTVNLKTVKNVDTYRFVRTQLSGTTRIHDSIVADVYIGIFGIRQEMKQKKKKKPSDTR